MPLWPISLLFFYWRYSTWHLLRECPCNDICGYGLCVNAALAYITAVLLLMVLCMTYFSVELWLNTLKPSKWSCQRMIFLELSLRIPREPYQSHLAMVATLPWNPNTSFHDHSKTARYVQWYQSLLWFFRIEQAKADGTSVVDGDSSYLYCKKQTVVASGIATSPKDVPQPPPVCGWEQLTAENHCDIAPKVPRVSFAHELAWHETGLLGTSKNPMIAILLWLLWYFHANTSGLFYMAEGVGNTLQHGAFCTLKEGIHFGHPAV